MAPWWLRGRFAGSSVRHTIAAAQSPGFAFGDFHLSFRDRNRSVVQGCGVRRNTSYEPDGAESMNPRIRSASLSGYVEIARAHGLDPFRMMRAAGLQPSCLRDPETRIDVAAVRRLLEETAFAGDIPDLGLQMARMRRLSSLGPISLLLREEPTARQALETLVRHMQWVNESLMTRLEEVDDTVVIREQFSLGEAVPVRQSMELAVGVMYRTLRELLGRDWTPRRVCFIHGAPRSLASHVKTFGRFVQFDCDFNGIVCAARDLEARNPSADPTMARYARHYLDSMLDRPDMTTGEKVSRLVHLLLPTGRCTIEVIAAELGIDRRTVHRHLASKGTTFSALLRSVRAEHAVRYLRDSRRPVGEIARALGFASQSALARWFREAFGTTVTEWRSRPAALPAPRRPASGRPRGGG